MLDLRTVAFLGKPQVTLASTLLLLAPLAACADRDVPQADDQGAPLVAVKVEAVKVASLSQPTELVGSKDGTLLVGQRTGVVKRIDPSGRTEPRVVVDVSDDVAETESESGFLSMDLSADEDELYMAYTRASDDATRLMGFRMNADGSAETPGREILLVPQPKTSHNGGRVYLDEGGLLWWALGDGGYGVGAKNGQDPAALLGSMIRIRPTLDGQTPYEVPDDNPFVDGVTPDGSPAAPEVWMYGMRNPWRFDFDPESGDLWLADVGNEDFEEINLLSAADGTGKGKNLGWDLREGSQPVGGAGSDEAPTNLVDPVFEYAHDEDRCAVIGGLTVRDAPSLPDLNRAFLWGDWCEGRLYALANNRGSATELDLEASIPKITSFGRGANGEIYAASERKDLVWRLQQVG